jgi:hypothetical protein
MTKLSNSVPAKINDRYSCVLDPTLALSDYGLPLVKQLGEVMDLWVARELWHILDNIHFYLQQPELLLSRNDISKRSLGIRYPTQEEIVRVLQKWEYICSETDLLGLRLFWVKDKLGESLLPNGINLDIIWRYEFLARSLNNQIGQRLDDVGETLTYAFRDTLALTAALESTFILTHQLPRDSVENSPPGICVALERWGISCQAVDPLDRIVTIERDYLRHMIVQTGLAKHIWSGLRLSVVHLLVPASNGASVPLGSQESSLSEIKSFIERPKSEKNLWEEAQGFWYQL